MQKIRADFDDLVFKAENVEKLKDQKNKVISLKEDKLKLEGKLKEAQDKHKLELKKKDDENKADIKKEKDKNKTNLYLLTEKGK